MRSLNFVIRLTEQCNLDCAYCYVSRESRKNSNTICDANTVERLYQLLSRENVRRVEFVWHGGEPLIYGKRNFSEVLAKQKQYFHDKGIVVDNALQTNGTLIDEDWVNIFQEHNISVGMSIDAPSDVHERLRMNWGGHGSLQRALEALTMLRRHSLPINAISVLNKLNVSRVREIFDFFQQLEIPFKLNPCSVEEDVNELTIEQLSISPREYGMALIDLFKYYVKTQDLRTSLTDLREIAASLFTGCSSNCLYSGQCENFFGMAVNGDVFFCDLFHVPQFRLGNVFATSFSNMVDNQTMERVKFRRDQLRGCHTCQFWSVCRGGCTTSAFAAYRDINREDYYCESRKLIFEFMRSRLIAPELSGVVAH